MNDVTHSTSTSNAPLVETNPTKGEQTRRSILDAAIDRFGRDGFRSTSVTDIARTASVGGTVAYAYFDIKEALFLAALDDDVAALLSEGLTQIEGERSSVAWHQELFFTLVRAIDSHPLARRMLAGLEPDVTPRVLEIPALAALRAGVAERLGHEQDQGLVRADIDPNQVGNGMIAILLSLLMSVVQIGQEATSAYADDVAAVLRAAMQVAPSGRSADGAEAITVR